MRTHTRFPLALTAATLLLACSDSSTDPPIDEPEVAEVDEFVSSLGSWEAYAQPKTDGEFPIPARPDSTVEEVMGATTYVCTVQPRSLTKTPNEIVMYEPNASIMWVGNLIQGDSYKGGQGSFEELSIRQRAPLKVSIDLLTGNNFAIVDDPSLTSVNAAIGGLIQAAHDAGHRAGSSIDYSFRRMHNEVEAMMKLGMSGSFTFGGIPADLKAETGWESNASLTGVFAHFTQKMFTISIELPQSAGSMFSEELTPELLQAQVDDGNIGPNNLPVYIASITYGRTLAYTLVDTKTETQLNAAVEASFKGIPNVASLGFQTEAELQHTLNATRLRATAIGGEGQNVIDLIREGNLSAYFKQDAPLTSARPISYQLNYLGNNSIAKVSETTEYDLRTCSEKPASPGLFDFAAVQSLSAGVNTPYEVLRGDLNGDGRGDLVLSSLSGGPNQTRVGMGNTDGSFTFGATIEHPTTPVEGWGDNYNASIGDFDGDGDDDLVWDRAGSPTRRVFVGLSDGSGGFDFLAVQELGGAWATEWTTHVGNIDNDADDDLFFNFRVGNNYSLIARSTGGGTLELGVPRQDHPVGASSAWINYEPFIADVDGGARDDDFVWNYVNASGGNHLYVGQSIGDTLSFKALQSFGSGWVGFENHVGDINGDSRADLIWTNADAGTINVNRAHGQGSGTFLFRQGQQEHPRDTGFFGDSGTIPAEVGDFNGDGLTDVLFNRRTASGMAIMVALGHDDGDFRFTPVPQNHPETEDWTQFTTLPLDVTGDAYEDVVWVQKSGAMKIYVATARN